VSDQAAAKPDCEHYWAYHVYDGLSVRLCQLCHEPDWADVRGQLEEAEQKGRLAVANGGDAVSVPPGAVTAEARATAAIAIARALIDAASDFGHGNGIAGDVWKLADAAYAAAAPVLRADERERIRQPVCAPGPFPPNLICMTCLRPMCRHCGGCECPETPALCLPETGGRP
jgi:hypothetical protein